MKQRKVPTTQSEQKTVKVPQSRFSRRAVDVPMFQKAKKMAEIPVILMPFVGRIVDVLVVLQEQMPTLHRVPRTVEFAQVPYDSMVGVPVVLRRQATTIQIEEKILNVTGTPCLDREVDVPVVMQQQTPMIR